MTSSSTKYNEFDLRAIRSLAVNAIASKDEYSDRTGKKKVSDLGIKLFEFLNYIEKL